MPSPSPICSAIGKHRELLNLTIFALFFLNSFIPSAATDTITPNQSIVDGQTLVSSGGTFELGFFRPGGSTKRYVGIWYKGIPDQKVVWVANGEAALTVAGGVLNLSADGNLSLHDRTGDVLWSTSTTNVSNPVVQLLDSGNLVLTEGSYGDSKSLLWQSFDHPGDIFLPGMKVGWDSRTNLDRHLTSWETTSDPSPGVYSFRLVAHGIPELYLENGSAPMSRIGWWDGRSWSGFTTITSNDDYLDYQFFSSQDEVYASYVIRNDSIVSVMVLNQFGVLQRLVWVNDGWQLYLQYPMDQCDMYAECGSYGRCELEGSSSVTIHYPSTRSYLK